MSDKTSVAGTLSPTDVLSPHDTAESSTPIWLVSDTEPLAKIEGLDAASLRWLDSTRFTGAAKKQAILPGAAGAIGGVALGVGNGDLGDPSGPSELLMGQLASSLPGGLYHLG